MKKLTKVLVVLLLAIGMCLSLTGCKSKEVKAVEEAIEAIGEVDYNSKEVIDEARKLYDALSEKDKEKVANAETLTAAEEAQEKAMADLLEDVMDEVKAFNQNLDVHNMKGVKENIANIKALFDGMNPDVKQSILASTSQGDQNVLSACEPMEAMLPDICLPDTDLARPQFVLSVAMQGSWIVDDREDFVAYNTWLSNSRDITTAYSEYREYVAQYTTVTDTDSGFTFENDLGVTYEVRASVISSNAILQVRVPVQ